MPALWGFKTPPVLRLCHAQLGRAGTVVGRDEDNTLMGNKSI